MGACKLLPAASLRDNILQQQGRERGGRKEGERGELDLRVLQNLCSSSAIVQIARYTPNSFISNNIRSRRSMFKEQACAFAHPHG